MIKLSSSVDFPSVSQLPVNEPYKLQFNLEISKDHIKELLNYLSNFQIIPKTAANIITETHIPGEVLESHASSILHELGIPAHIMGFRYLKDAIILTVRDRKRVNSITKSIYPEIASIHNTTSSRVERAIRHAIEVAWTRGNIDTVDEMFGYSVNPETGRPTNSEFIALVSDRVRAQSQSCAAPKSMCY